jgi:hypothetical protein
VSRALSTVRLEGALFGYPSCCIESFVANGYLENGRTRSDQQILFHWACRGCTVTPVLLPRYREIARECRRRLRCGDFRSAARVRPWLTGEWVKRGLAAATSIAALGALPAVPVSARADHLIALPTWMEDADSDLLSDAEEKLLCTDPANADENANHVRDGVDLARELSSLIDSLPTAPSTTQPYVVNHLARGTEACEACGSLINMGFLEIVNPMQNQSLSLPYMAKHFLEYGGFSYEGSIHAGRVNPRLLQAVLTSNVFTHLIGEPPETDHDRDALRDWEEPLFGLDWGNDDEDDDGIPDGVGLARELLGEIESLPRALGPEDAPTNGPFVIEHPMDGVETCPMCGETVVMDVWVVTNPVVKASVAVPSMALHCLRHGGFAWRGGRLLGGRGRVDPRRLRYVLTGEPDPHWLPVPEDRDEDLVSDGEEEALCSDPDVPDEDGNQIPDGMDLAYEMWRTIAALPRRPRRGPYAVEHRARGSVTCQVCGERVNMGFVDVLHPRKGVSIHVSYLALHFMQRGSFSALSLERGGERVDPVLLTAALRPSVVIAVDREARIRWKGEKGTRYEVLSSPDLSGPWDLRATFEGSGEDLVFTDPGVIVPCRFYKICAW